MFDVPISNLGLAVVSILGLVACSLFIAKGVVLVIDVFLEYLK